MKKIKGKLWRKKRLKRIRNIIFLLLMLFIGKSICYVDAGMNDTVISKNRVDGIYAVGMVDGKKHLYYLNMYQMNGRVAYCIELGKDITSDIYHSTPDFSILSLTEEQIHYIRAISYYGYQYPGHTSYYYYMATQEIIWEYLSNKTIDIEWTNVLDVNGERIDIYRYIKQILELYSRYDNDINLLLPDNTEWQDGQTYLVGDEIILRDASQLLPLYDIEINGHADVTIDRDILSIKLSDEYVGNEVIKLDRKDYFYYDYDNVLYYYDYSQKLISNGNYRDFKTEISFFVQGDKLQGIVIDEKTKEAIPQGEASFVGAMYELYDKNKDLIGSYKTNEDGKFIADNLAYGTYYIKQVQASEGYLLNDKEICFEFSKDNPQIILEQKAISNIIEIQKVYEEKDGSYQFEENVLFQIFDSSGNLYDEIITNEVGKVSIEVPYGIYNIKQGNVMLGYEKVDDFQVNTKEKINQVFHYNLVNTLIRCNIKIISFDKDSGEKLELVGFSYRIRKKDADEYLKVNGNDIFKTNQSGELVFPMTFTYDEYILELVDVPKNIFLDKKEIEIIINDQTDFRIEDNFFIVDILDYHSFIKGRINLLATEEVFYFELNDYGYQKKIRQDKEFLLIANDNILDNGKIIFQKGDIVFEGKTNDQGKLIISNLDLGKYCLIDNETVEEQCFEIDSVSNKSKIVDFNIEFTKLLDKGNIQVKNNTSDGDAILGTVFEVYNDDNKKIYTGVTNDEGIFYVSNLLYGNYCVFQKKVSTNYLVNLNKKCFVLNGDKVVEFINEKQEKRTFFVPDTFSDTNDWRKLILLIIFGMGVLIYKKVFCYHSN